MRGKGWEGGGVVRDWSFKLSRTKDKDKDCAPNVSRVPTCVCRSTLLSGAVVLLKLAARRFSAFFAPRSYHAAI